MESWTCLSVEVTFSWGSGLRCEAWAETENVGLAVVTGVCACTTCFAGGVVTTIS